MSEISFPSLSLPIGSCKDISPRFFVRTNHHQDFVSYPRTTETFYYADLVDIVEAACDLSTIGGYIKYYRLLKELYQDELSKHSGIDRVTLIRYENNQCPHSLELCNKLVATLQIDPHLLYDDYLKFVACDCSALIKAKRKELGLTQKQFGKQLGVRQKTISAWEQETSCPMRENFELIQHFIRN